MGKKIAAAFVILLSLWNIFYVAILADSLVEEYFMDKFFYWGYPQWGILYSSPQVFLWFNVAYLSFAVICIIMTFGMLKNHTKTAIIPALLITVLSLVNAAVPDYTREQEFIRLDIAENEDNSLPDGQWLIRQSEIQKFADQSTLMKLKGIWGRGEWPGGHAFWGDYRMWLLASNSTDTHGRRGFVVHGGTKKGSPWGVNMGKGLNNFAKDAIKYGAPLEMTVNR